MKIVWANLQIQALPIDGVYPLLKVGQHEPDDILFKGDFWMNGWIQDTVLSQNRWSLSRGTKAWMQIRVDNLQISNLERDPRFHWSDLASGTRFGMKTFMGLNRDNWLDPEPRGVLIHDSISISDGVITLYNAEFQSNKLNVSLSGNYSLEGPGTDIRARILRTRSYEKEHGRPEYNNLMTKDFTRSQLRPYLKYKLYSDKQKRKVAKDKGIEYSEVEDGYYKVHSNLGYTLGTLPRRIKFLFAKNPNKETIQKD